MSCLAATVAPACVAALAIATGRHIRFRRRARVSKAAIERDDHYVNLDGVYGHVRSLRR